jgi:hypothetical protein
MMCTPITRAAVGGLIWIIGLSSALAGGDTALFPPERYMEHEKFLASDALEGRRPGTPGIEEAATYISYQFMMAGLQPAGTNGTFYQPFEVRGGKRLTRADAALTFTGIDGERLIGKDWTPMPFGGTGDAAGPVAFAGFGIEYSPEPPSTQPDAQPATPELPYNDYGSFDATGKVLMIFRHEPRAKDPNAKFGGKEPSGKSLFVNKANLAADKGAKALLVVNPPDWDADGDGKPDQDELYAWNDSERASYRLPIVQISQALAEKLLAKGGMPDLKTLLHRLESERKPLAADVPGVSTDIKTGVRNVEARNVIGLLVGSERPDEYIVVGAHYDHLGNVPVGMGEGREKQIHNGADDNASGTSGVMELARVIGAGPRPKRSILFMTFSAEEMGLLGSAHYVKKPTVELSKIKAMINLDMIGRLGQDELEIYGIPCAKEFPDLVSGLAKEYGIKYKAPANNSRFFAQSDHASFFYKGIPVLFAFTGVHPQYHKPEDDWELIDAEGATKLLGMFHQIVTHIANMEQGPTPPSVEEERATGAEPKPKTPAQQADEAAKQRAQDAQDSGDPASRRPRVRLGFMPSYDDTGPGALVDRVVPEGAAEKAGMKKGDRIMKIGKKDVSDFNGYMDAMKDVQPGDEIEVMVKRDNETVTLKIKASTPGDRR